MGGIKCAGEFRVLQGRDANGKLLNYVRAAFRGLDK